MIVHTAHRGNSSASGTFLAGPVLYIINFLAKGLVYRAVSTVCLGHENLYIRGQKALQCSSGVLR